MPKDLVVAFRDGIFLRVEKILTVGRPLDRRNTFDLVRQHLSSSKVLDLKRELPVAGSIGREGEQIAIVARLECTDGKKLVSLRHFVLVEKSLRTRAVATLAPQESRILFPFFRLRDVPVFAYLCRDAEIGLLDTAEHFLVELIDKRLVFAHMRLGERVLGFQILDYLRILFVAAVAQPGIVVDDLVTMDLQDLRVLLRRGRSQGLLSGTHIFT